MSRTRWTTRAVLGPALAAGLGIGAPAGAQEIAIGATAPLSGPAANTGEALRQGFMLAVKEWNEGRGDYVSKEPPKVTLSVEDTQAKPEVAISAAQRLITRNKIALLVGDGLNSHVTLALMEMAPQYNLPILSAEPVSSAIADKVRSNPQRYALYWKGNFNSDGYGNAVHAFYRDAFAKKLLPEGGKRIAFVVEDTDYGISNAQKVGELFQADGWTVVATEKTPTGQTDFYPQLSKVRAASADVVVSVFTVANAGAAFVRQLKEQDLKGSHLAIYYPTKPEFMEAAKNVTEGLYWASLQYAPTIVDAHRKFSDKIQAEFKVPGTYSHAHGYCTMVVALRALDAAGKGAKATAIAEKIGASDYRCVYGRFKFGAEDHTVMAGPDHIPIPVAQVQSGQSQIIWPETVATAKAR